LLLDGALDVVLSWFSLFFENLRSLKTLEQSRTPMITGFQSESSTK